MNAFLLVVLVGVPLAWLAGFAAYAYVDAPNHGMNPSKWAAISFFVPLFGFFAYLFERAEQDYDPEEDPYAAGDGTFAIHESRRGESPLGPAGTPEDDAGGADDNDVGGTNGNDGSAEGGGESADTDDEWSDPSDV